MAIQNQEARKQTHVRVFTEKKKRVEKVVRTLAYNQNARVKEVDLVDQILEEGLSKRERKLGIN